jgi:hypothetical protein
MHSALSQNRFTGSSDFSGFGALRHLNLELAGGDNGLSGTFPMPSQLTYLNLKDNSMSRCFVVVVVVVVLVVASYFNVVVMCRLYRCIGKLAKLIETPRYSSESLYVIRIAVVASDIDGALRRRQRVHWLSGSVAKLVGTSRHSSEWLHRLCVCDVADVVDRALPRQQCVHWSCTNAAARLYWHLSALQRSSWRNFCCVAYVCVCVVVDRTFMVRRRIVLRRVLSHATATLIRVLVRHCRHRRR